MSIENIKENILEIYQNTPDYVGVMFGKKSKNNITTDENCIIFTVEKKIPLSEVPENEILPSVIEINGVEYNTDVLEIGVINTLQSCQPLIGSGCYEWNNGVIQTNLPFCCQRVGVPANRNTIRPLQQGISVTSVNNDNSVGTLGFFAVDNVTNSIVGVSNNHVLIGDAFYTSERVDMSVIENEYFDSTLQSIEGVVSSEEKIIGDVLRYSPIKKRPEINYIDGALTTINNSGLIASGLDNSTPKSWFFYGLSGLSNTVLEEPMEFATTSEIDNLITNPPSEVWSVGRTTGVKQGPCGLRIDGIGLSTSVNGYQSQGLGYVVTFADTIAFTRLNNNCPWPIAPGDSGSALIAVINGKTKIIGLCFAGSPYFGIACRIDRVAQELDIKQWNGVSNEYFDGTVQDIFTVFGSSEDKILLCGGEEYWQIGNTLNNLECDCQAVEMTFTATTNTTVGFSIQGTSNFTMIVNWGDNNVTRYNGNSTYSPTHTYTANGTYQVQVSVSDCSLIQTLNIQGTINDVLPLTNISGIDMLGSLQNLLINYTDLSSFDPTIALPSTLQNLVISNCKISSFDTTLPLPSGLLNLTLSNNLLTSFNPTLTLPLTLTTINLYFNNLNTNNVNIALDTLSNIVWVTSPTRFLDIRQNPAAPPSVGPPDGIQAKISLQGIGWTVNSD